MEGASEGIRIFFEPDVRIYIYIYNLISLYLSSSHLTSSHLSSSHLTSHHLSPPHTTLAHPTAPHLTSHHLSSSSYLTHTTSSHTTLPYPTLPRSILPHPTSPRPRLILSYLILSYLILSYLILSYLILSYLTAHLTLPRLTLPYLNPPYLFSQFSKLADPTVWKDAATQMFYSISVGFGAMITFASYNPIHNNVVRDAIIIVALDAATCVFAGVIVFSILGYRQHLTGIPVTEVSVHIKQKENSSGVTAKYLINRHIVLVYIPWRWLLFLA